MAYLLDTIEFLSVESKGLATITSVLHKFSLKYMYKDRKRFAFSSAPKGSQGFLAFLEGVNKKKHKSKYMDIVENDLALALAMDVSNSILVI